MQEWINKSCKVYVKREDGKCSLYTVKTVTDVSNSHITFVDKYNVVHTFLKDRILEISSLPPGVFED